MSPTPPPGWYPDPSNTGYERYWDGSNWSVDTRPSLPSPPPAGMGYGSPADSSNEKPNSYLAWAIVATVLCCLPLGIPAIVYASKVDSAWSSGQYDDARRYSASAKKWSIAAAASFGVIVAAYIALVVLLGSITSTV